MTSAEIELTHLLALAAPPFREAWKVYVEKKAEALARKYPKDYAQLPEMLRAALQSKGTCTSGTGAT